MSKVADRVKQIVAQNLGIENEKIIPEASFTKDLGADSLDQVELVMALEDEFGCEISDEDAEKIQTFGLAVQYIEEKLKASSDLGKAPAA